MDQAVAQFEASLLKFHLLLAGVKPVLQKNQSDAGDTPVLVSPKDYLLVIKPTSRRILKKHQENH